MAPAVIGDNHSGRTFINRALGIVGGKYALNHNRARPSFAYPSEVIPRHDSVGESRGDVEEWHGTLTGYHDVLKFWNTAIEQERGEPCRVSENLRKIWDFGNN